MKQSWCLTDKFLDPKLWAPKWNSQSLNWLLINSWLIARDFSLPTNNFNRQSGFDWILGLGFRAISIPNSKPLKLNLSMNMDFDGRPHLHTARKSIWFWYYAYHLKWSNQMRDFDMRVPLHIDFTVKEIERRRYGECGHFSYLPHLQPLSNGFFSLSHLTYWSSLTALLFWVILFGSVDLCDCLFAFHTNHVEASANLNPKVAVFLLRMHMLTTWALNSGQLKQKGK